MNAEIDNPPVEAPIEQYVKWAYDHQAQLEDEQTWNSPLWRFTRLLKAHRKLNSESPSRALHVVETQLALWSKTQDRDRYWTDWFDVASGEDAHVEFLTVWVKVRFLPGEEPLDQAAKRASQVGLEPATSRTEGYKTFISLAGWLQVIMGDRNILLPCEKLSSYLNCEAMTVSRYRRWAVEDGLLVIMKPHRFRGPGFGEATEFRFDTSRFDVLRELAKRPPDR